MITISTHVLDTARGRPASGITIRLLHGGADGAWREVASGVTDSDGRIPGFAAAAAPLAPGRYQMRFETGTYLRLHAGAAFFPHVEVVCDLAEAGHYHLPLLLSPYGYSTYRGS